MRIQFIGAAGGKITGSCTLFNHMASGTTFLVDCGLAQGEGQVDAHNTQAFPFDAASVRFVLLTHAHLDHCGLLPKLYREGFQGDVFCTQPTAELARLALMDGAKYPGSMFNVAEVEAVRFAPVEGRQAKSKWMPMAQDLTVAFQRTAHIVGAASIVLKWKAADGKMRHTVMSGDLGNNTKDNCYQSLLAHRKGLFGYPDHVVVESTYGSRDRDRRFKDFDERINTWCNVINTEVFSNKATLIIPAFALQRTHEVLLDIAIALKRLSEESAPVAPCLAPNPHYEHFEGGKWYAVVQQAIELALTKQPACTQDRFRSAIIPVQDGGKQFTLAPTSDLTIKDVEELVYHTEIPYPVDVVLDSVLAREMGEVLKRALQQRRPGRPDEHAYRNPELYSRLGVENDDALDVVLDQLFKNGAQGNVNFPWGAHSIHFCKKYELPSTAVRLTRGTILITGGGMCDGGPVVSHLKNVICEGGPNVLVQVGYMAPASRGGQTIAAIKADFDRRPFEPFEIDRQPIEPGSTRLRHTDMSAFYSGHADQAGLIDFVMRVSDVPAVDHEQIPVKVYINHGSAGARQDLMAALEARAAEQRDGDRKLASVVLPQADGKWIDLETGLQVEHDHEIPLDEVVRQLLVEQRETNHLLRVLVRQGEAQAALAAKMVPPRLPDKKQDKRPR
jgi:Cft2 family RNA processing exonuclease